MDQIEAIRDLTQYAAAGASHRSTTDMAPAFRTRDAVLNAAHRDVPDLENREDGRLCQSS
ncbi:hypothetical protein [Micromonospora sp. KC207]|uniref:hypothetical protein n=1 Tax=Micromonospora sp. KC207 TaxID=2530377 RepID=UPI00104ECB34|nr:hypothetical protein [Micromonospora sp. KC207]